MKIGSLIALLTLLLPVSVQAEVFKCKVNGKTVYQHEPCAANAIAEGIIRESSPQKVEQDKLKLQAWQDQLAADEAAKKEAEKQRQDEVAKQEALELQRRSVLAQERQAIAAQQTPKTLVVPVPLAPAYNQRYWNNNIPPNLNNDQFYPYHHQKTHHQDQQQITQQQDIKQQEIQTQSRPRPMALPPERQTKP